MVWYGVLAVRRMGQTVVKVAVGIGGLVVDGCSYSVIRYGEAKVQKRNRRLADFKGVLQRRMISGTKLYNCSRSCGVPEDASSTSSI